MTALELREASITVDLNGSGATGRVPACYRGECMRWDEFTDMADLDA